jgi:hypothetical protein
MDDNYPQHVTLPNFLRLGRFVIKADDIQSVEYVEDDDDYPRFHFTFNNGRGLSITLHDTSSFDGCVYAFGIGSPAASFVEG